MSSRNENIDGLRNISILLHLDFIGNASVVLTKK